MHAAPLFPARRGRKLAKAGKFPFESKALAIREQKPYVFHKPQLSSSFVSIYLDVEGLPKQDFIYLISCVIVHESGSHEIFYFWSYNPLNKKNIFKSLFQIFESYPEAIITRSPPARISKSILKTCAK